MKILKNIIRFLLILVVIVFINFCTYFHKNIDRYDYYVDIDVEVKYYDNVVDTINVKYEHKNTKYKPKNEFYIVISNNQEPCLVLLTNTKREFVACYVKTYKVLNIKIDRNEL